MYHIDGLIHDHEVLFSWPSKYVNQCIDFKKGNFLGSMLLSRENPLVPRLQKMAIQVIKALPNPEGSAYHMEVFHNPKTDVITFYEIASRVGGGLIRQIHKLAFEYDIAIEHLKLQSGFKPKLKYHQMPSTLGGWILMSAKGGTVRTAEEPKNIDNLIYIQMWLKPGEKVQTTENISGSIAEIGYRASSEEESLNKIKEIVKELELGIIPIIINKYHLV